MIFGVLSHHRSLGMRVGATHGSPAARRARARGKRGGGAASTAKTQVLDDGELGGFFQQMELSMEKKPKGHRKTIGKP